MHAERFRILNFHKFVSFGQTSRGRISARVALYTTLRGGLTAITGLPGRSALKNKDGGQNHSVAGRSKSGEFTCHYSPPICHVLFLREVIRARLILRLLMLSLMFRLSLLQTNCKQTDKILKFESDCVTLYVMHRCCIVDISSHTVDFQVSYT